MKLETPFELGPLHISPQQCQITSDTGAEKILQPKFIDVLTYLAAHYPRLVTREELIDTIWQGNFPVGEKALTNAVWHLRQHLKTNEQPFIETVRKRGYRLLVAPNYQQPSTTVAESKPLNSTNKNKKAPLAAIVKPLTTMTKTLAKPFKAITAVIMACFILFTALHLFEDHDLPPAQISNITTDPGRELFPVVSADSRYMAYVWHRIGRPSDLYIKDLDDPAKAPRQLTFDDKTEVRPVWHPGAKKLYFVQESWDEQHCNVIELTLTTMSQKVIAHCPANINISLAINATGSILAYTGNSPNAPKPGIYFIDLTRPNAVPTRFSCVDNCLYRDRNFAFSPDGTQLAISRRVESLIEDIFVVDIDTKHARQLTFGQGDIVGLVWHPDGERIVYAMESFGAREGYVIDVDSGNIIRLNVPGFSFPDFIPVNHQMVYHNKQTNSHIAYLPLSDALSAMPFPLLQSQFSHDTPHYSPTAQRLAFISNESGHNEVYSSKLNGDDRRQLTHLNTNLYSPSWSHDGQSIAFIGPRADKQGNNLLVLDVNTLKIQKLDSPFNEHKRPSWTWDDSAVMTAAANNNSLLLYAFSIDGGQPRQLLQQNVKFAIQTTDQSLWFSTDNQGLWRYQPNQPQTPPVQVLTKGDFNIGYNWTVTNNGVYFQHDHNNHQRINYYDFDTEKIRSLVKLPSRSLARVGSMTYITSHNKIVFTQSQPPLVDIKRLEHPLLF
ncbi:MAG: winged helix-turn-helix transcriptional regulator [Psychrosphaera sp.]|nr:winged helix-turn-helix transcriptional regulator [Psychrosphaera sp.]